MTGGGNDRGIDGDSATGAFGVFVAAGSTRRIPVDDPIRFRMPQSWNCPVFILSTTCAGPGLRAGGSAGCRCYRRP